MEFLQQHNLLGLVIGISTYFGTRCWWAFLLLGIICGVLTIMVENVLFSALLGVTAFSSFWSILEIFEQQERVRKGWFPKNPKRKYPFDNEK